MKCPLAAQVLIVSLAVPTAAQDLRKEDFAYGIRIQTEAEAPLYRVPLPLSLYRSVVRDDLGDLRVFNAGGAVVPHELWSPPVETSGEARDVEARLFPLREATSTELAEVRVLIEDGGERASLLLAPAREGERSPVAAYVLDPGMIDSSFVAERLVLFWQEPGEPFVRKLRLEESDDLSSWSTLGTAVMADLRHDGGRLLRNDLTLERKVGRYLKLTIEGGTFPFALERATLAISSKVRRVETAWLSARETRALENGIQFQTPGPVLVNAIEILPEEKNTWTEVELYSRTDPDSEWNLASSSTVYSFEVAGEQVSRTGLAVRDTRDRYWKLTTDEARGGFGQSPPRIRVGYRPDHLVFVARGNPPFELVYGSRRVGPPPPGNATLRALDRVEPAVAFAVGEPHAISGETALAKPLVPDWKRFTLWSVLALASVVLLLTARAALSRTG